MLEEDRSLAIQASQGNAEAINALRESHPQFFIGRTDEQAAIDVFNFTEIELREQRMLVSLITPEDMSTPEQAPNPPQDPVPNEESNSNQEFSSDEDLSSSSDNKEDLNDLKRKIESDKEDNNTDLEESPKKKKAKYDDDDSKGGPSGTAGPSAEGGSNIEPSGGSDSQTNLRDSIVGSFLLFAGGLTDSVLIVLENMSLFS